MGITAEKFFENVYNVMFSPKRFFEEENPETSLRLAAGIIIFMSVVNKVSEAINDSDIYSLTVLFKLFNNVVLSLIMWFLIALFIEYTAKIFEKGGNLGKFLYLSAFASIPALFFAPLNLIKNINQEGYYLSVVLSCILYVWIVILYAFSVKSAYKITLARAFMLIFLPIIGFIPLIYQVAGFCIKMWYIFSI